MARWRYRQLAVGDYTDLYWTYEYRSGKYIYTPEKPDYRNVKIKQKTGEEIDLDWGPTSTYKRETYNVLDNEQDIINAVMTIKNSSPGARNEQAAILAHYGYGGPVSGGEARALKSLFTELGHTDLVKHGWVNNTVSVKQKHTARQLRHHKWHGTPLPALGKVDTTRLQQCYVFKSPIEAIPFDKFIKLARLYKDDSGKLKKAVVALLANPDAHKEIEALDTLEVLGGLTGL